MTSQASSPIRSQSRASWLTKAMLTLRKVFSSSFAASAASGEESSMTVSLIRRRSVAARAVVAGVAPPTRRGIVRPADTGSPGLIRSGAKASSKSWPARSPDARSIDSRKGPIVVPGKVVLWRMTIVPGTRWRPMSSAAESTGERSGSFDAVTGVGTQTKTASAVAIASAAASV